MVDKLMGLHDAVELVNDGDLVTLSGVSLHRNPMAFTLALVESAKRDLALVDREPGLAFDLLILSGKVSRVRVAMATLEQFGTAPGFRRMVEAGEVEVTEDVCEAFMAGIRAGAFGLSFMPSDTALDSEVTRINVSKGIWRIIEDPFDPQREVLVVKAIRPDVAIIHVHRADPRGDAEIRGPKYEDILKAQAADKVIITTEEVVDEDYFREDPERLHIHGFQVSAVVHAPRGAYPTSMYGLYPANYDAVSKYVELVKSGASLKEVLGVLR
jgi:glutaconate CoA-transferase subunit A